MFIRFGGKGSDPCIAILEVREVIVLGCAGMFADFASVAS
jgi:hypothetical protein